MLYGYGVATYGLFHMLDYLVFVGLGVFFALSVSRNATLLSPARRFRVTLKRSVQRIMSGIKFFSASELLGGGTVLATIALIAFGGLPLTQPQNLPAPKRYASVSIPSSEPSVKSSLEQPRHLSDVAEATREARSPESRSGTGNSALTDSNGATAPEPPATDRSAARTAGRPVALSIQQHGVEVDTQGVFTDVWGPPLLHPPRDSRLANGQLRDVPAPPSVSAEPSFIGGWSDDIGGCRTGRKAPLVINSHAAKTANGECDFGVRRPKGCKSVAHRRHMHR